VGSNPFLGRRYLLLGRQNLCFTAMNVINGSPNCVLFCFMGRQLPNVENTDLETHIFVFSFHQNSIKITFLGNSGISANACNIYNKISFSNLNLHWSLLLIIQVTLCYMRFLVLDWNSDISKERILKFTYLSGLVLSLNSLHANQFLGSHLV